ncbi:hypothetical protein HRG_004128 [Hirsutella rhossiliensis]|uniref:Hydroxymethylglutaryl-coenzyme A synthase C-terminal domain-containing protein n=1 Tax=Hirsutella rhossiliensis TaxID=111463 RepID=A0A9P8N3W3_9HYPO|nr:uncharacterized protein HRG_04128 [Hirsutella rhossiliensis]KAH0966112.1 hypothetical protein HRG_04128 [Hirsutella rhossiliensis]
MLSKDRYVSRIEPCIAGPNRRHVATPEEYQAAVAPREKAYRAKNYTPTGDVSTLATGIYYLERIDEAFRRTYAVKE